MEWNISMNQFHLDIYIYICDIQVDILDRSVDISMNLYGVEKYTGDIYFQWKMIPHHSLEYIYNI